MKLIARSKQGNMLKMEDTTNPKGYVWYFLAPGVLELAQTFEYGTELTLTVEQKSEGETITDIKIGKGDVVVKSNGEFACAKCGAKLKDGTYKTCYTCSMEIRKQTENSPEEKTKQDSIKRQAIGHMTSRTLIALQGHVDPNNVNAIAESIYKKYIELVG
jgi:ferredoxin